MLTMPLALQSNTPQGSPAAEGGCPDAATPGTQCIRLSARGMRARDVNVHVPRAAQPVHTLTVGMDGREREHRLRRDRTVASSVLPVAGRDVDHASLADA